MSASSNMYEGTKTWNPFVGCTYDCTYCEPSFKRQLKRVGKRIGCEDCYAYRPHTHPERLKRIPGSPIVFVCGTSDISYSPANFTNRIIDAVKKKRSRSPQTFYFQSKNPKYFQPFLPSLRKDERIVLLTTLETNRDKGYSSISKAPVPSVRFKDFYDLEFPRKVLTIEPVLDFDLNPFIDMVKQLHKQGTLEYVWFGFDSKKCGLPEPSIQKAQRFVNALKKSGVMVKSKTLNGVVV